MIGNFGNINTLTTGEDYLKIRQSIIDSFRWSNNNTPSEIDRLIDIFGFDPTVDKSTNDSNKITHLMSFHGLTLEQSTDFLIEKFACFHLEERKCLTKRRNSQKLTIVVSKYLSFSDARDFIETTKTLMDLYSQDGIVGLNYGVVGEGIIDYIESTPGSSYENTGLEIKGYFAGESDPAASLQSFIDALKDVLINGNY